MATNRKRTPRSRKDTGLTGAEEMFVFGKTDKHVNPFEMMELEYPIHADSKAKVEKLKLLRHATVASREDASKVKPSRSVESANPPWCK